MTIREIRCDSCGTLNRVPRYPVVVLPKCGQCGTALPESQITKYLRFLYRNRVSGLLGAALFIVAGFAWWPQISDWLKPPLSLPADLIVSTPPPTPPLPSIARPAVPDVRVPVCQIQPANGDLLGSYRASVDQGHRLDIDNASMDTNAIVRIRNADTGRRVVSFFVAAHAIASLDHIPDGRYRIQYAVGTELAADCTRFARPIDVMEFPGVDTFVTERTQTQTGWEIVWPGVRYTLYAVPSGTIRPRSIDLKNFDAE